ncbi:MAG: EscU/YscU/HrcU family type III secretion system export apparatus switch protein [Planctomycetes bacterium]|nr:EscU/YscU/HrcU family type III secretion system export apparatus switch protein [Planctomycetota bacterium]
MADMFDKNDRTEEATAKKQEDSHARGQFARSTDLSTACVLMAAAAALLATGPGLLQGLRQGIVGAIRGLDNGPDSIGAASAVLRVQLMIALRYVLPFLGAAAGAALAVHFAQAGGFFIARDAIGWKTERLDPVANLGRMLSAKGFAKVGGALLKLLLIVTVFVFALRGRLEEVATYSSLAFEQSSPQLGALLLDLFLRCCAALLVLGFGDYMFQRWQHGRELRMTKQQVRDEMKEQDGDPQVKRRIRDRMRSFAERPLAQAVGAATVVVTNPTHFAVALEYAEGKSAAPRLVAKGVDLLAQEIRRIARDANVPVIEQPPLARALFREVQVGDLIPEKLYRAVASVLAIVWKLRDARRKPVARAAGAGRN